MSQGLAFEDALHKLTWRLTDMRGSIDEELNWDEARDGRIMDRVRQSQWGIEIKLAFSSVLRASPQILIGWYVTELGGVNDKQVCGNEQYVRRADALPPHARFVGDELGALLTQDISFLEEDGNKKRIWEADFSGILKPIGEPLPWSFDEVADFLTEKNLDGFVAYANRVKLAPIVLVGDVGDGPDD